MKNSRREVNTSQISDVGIFISKTFCSHKLFFVVIAILFMSFGVGYAADKQNEDEVQLPCCSYVTVNTEVTEDCCLRIAVFNPYCPGVRIEFAQEIDGQFQIQTIISTQNGDTAVYTMCPMAGDTEISYRIRLWAASVQRPFCAPDVWLEGSTQYTGTVPLNCCSCPPDVNDWLTVSYVQDPNCIGCLVKYELNIPESITCYKAYAIYTDYMPGGKVGWLDTQPISGHNICVGVGQSFNINLFLLTEHNTNPNYHHTHGCRISDVVRCDSIPIEPGDTSDVYEPCYPDCENYTWETPYKTGVYHILNCPGCRVEVTYTWRRACPQQYQDLQIIKLKPLDEACNQCSPEHIYHQALGAIIAHNQMGFDPQIGHPGCNDTWRISSGACMAFWREYTWDGNHIDSIEVWEPCNDSDCCLQRMRVCRDASDGVTFNILPPPAIAGCYGAKKKDPQTGEPLTCEPICDWLASMHGYYPYQEEVIGPGGKFIEDLDSKDKSIYSIMSEQDENTLRIWIKSNKSGNASVELYDLAGNYIGVVTKSIGNGLNNIDYTLNQLQSGVYIYQVVVDGLKLKSDKILINR